MDKKIIRIGLISIITIMATFNMQASENKSALPILTLENIEALASGEVSDNKYEYST